MISTLFSHQLRPENESSDRADISSSRPGLTTSNIAVADDYDDNHHHDDDDNHHDDDAVHLSDDNAGVVVDDEPNDNEADNDFNPCYSQVNIEHEGYLPCSSKCKVCCALPFRRSTKDDESEGILWDDASPWDWDGGLYDLVCQLNDREQYPRLPADVATVTVEATTKHLALLKDQLMKDGLQKQYNQNYCGVSLSSSRVIAPFDFSELELGQLLGNGGFSSVSEVLKIRPNSRNAKRFNPMEQKSRLYLANNVLCKIEKTTHSQGPKKLLDSSTGKLDKRSNRAGYYCTQYAVKHLRNRLVTRTPEKFKRAAIDLVLEGQLLLLLDHPNIVSLRGRCVEGPQAFANGDPRGVFLILDKLPISLEDRMGEWRILLLKYQRQLKRQAVIQQRSQVISNWARKALRRNQTEDKKSSAPTTKAAIAIQNLLLERLIIVYKIGLAIQYMHSKRLIHRDLKVSNVGFDIYRQVKLFDFGLSRLLPNTSDQYVGSLRGDALDCCESTTTGSMSESYVMSRVGTKFYMAPEVRRKEPYSLPADVYSFGVIVWEVLTLSTPREFYHHERDRVSKLAKEKVGGGIKSGNDNKVDAPTGQGNDGHKIWLPICPCWPVGIRELVTATMASDPIDRPTMEQILVILQNHIDTLSVYSMTTTTSNESQHHRPSNSRVDLSNVDLRYLDKVDRGENEGNISSSPPTPSQR